MGTVIVPFTAFALKRALYMVNYTICHNDTPFKGHAVLLATVECLHHVNLLLSTSAIMITSWNDAVSFIVIDWAIFTFRISMVGRLGYKQCPKLVTFLVNKQMENLPIPLENPVKANGEKTAMAVFQAYVCLCEGETMTCVYMVHILFFFIRWVCVRDYEVVEVFPLRSFLVLVMYTGLDFIQDLLADRMTGKFSHWSFLYSGTGLFSKRYLPFLVMLSNQLGSWYCCSVGKIPRQLMMKVTRLPQVFVDVAWSPPGFVHL